MQAIQTKYVGPTNHRGARIISKASARSIIVPWDYSLDPFENHKRAAAHLVEQLHWTGCWYGGELPDGTYGWVCAPDWAYAGVNYRAFRVNESGTEGLETPRVE